MKEKDFTLRWCLGQEFGLGEPIWEGAGVYHTNIVINGWVSPLYVESNLKLRRREIWWGTPVANVCIGELPYGPTTNSVANFFSGYTRRQVLDEEVIDK
jgi:hypothetical protein